MRRSIVLVASLALCLALTVPSAVKSAYSPPTTLVQQHVLQTLPNQVASGDTTHTSTVLWARSNNRGPVFFFVSTDPNFTNSRSIVRILRADVTQPSVPGTRHSVFLPRD